MHIFQPVTAYIVSEMYAREATMKHTASTYCYS